MSELGIECVQCQCNFFSLNVDVNNSELKARCEMCQRLITLSVDELSIRMLKKKQLNKKFKELEA